MSSYTAFPALESLWFETNQDALICCSCRLKICPAALIRTFRFCRSKSREEPREFTRKISLPFDEDIVLYDRHLQCLLRSAVGYSAISHVWDPLVSQTQYFGRLVAQSMESRRLVIQKPLFIYRGLLRSGRISEADEIWHDYISVPQWSENIKNMILLATPDIYGSASVTTVHFEGLRGDSIQMLYESESTLERLKSITDICNNSWFTRVWTAMEYVRSREVIAIDENFKVCSDRNDPLFLHRMLDLWGEEISKHESVHELESKADMGKNLVPWNLGPLMNMGKGKSSAFGQAFALLSQRRCQSNHDFVHALLGLVKPSSERPLERDFDREYLYVAKLCLAAGDYTPLLITPRLEKYDSKLNGSQGYNDVGIWPLGAERQPPDFHQDFAFENDDREKGEPVLKMIKLGTISHIYRRHTESDNMAVFALEASIVLKATGPNPASFIDTLGSRLYDGKPPLIKQALMANNEWDKLASTLRKRHDEELDNWPIEGPDGARWLAKAMTLSLKETGDFHPEPMSRMAYLNSHGGTIHAGHIGLNCVLSVPCTSCHQTLVFRAGFFEAPCTALTYVAYRIPGTMYRFSHPNGLGVVMRDGRVVGRMAWATPACDCLETEKVRIKMPTLPRPCPKPYQ